MNSSTTDPSTDQAWERYRDLDFAAAKSVAQVPALARLQAERRQAVAVTLPVEPSVLAAYQARAAEQGTDYTALMGQALRQYMEDRRHP